MVSIGCDRPTPNEGEGHVLAGVHAPLDWDHVERAFRAANQAVGWGADIILTPGSQRALVCFPCERATHVENTISIFNRVVERHIGLEAFRSIGIDLEPRSASPGSPSLVDGLRAR